MYRGRKGLCEHDGLLCLEHPRRRLPPHIALEDSTGIERV